MSTCRIWRPPVYRLRNVVVAAFIGSVLLWACSARSEQPNPNSWQGEWSGVSGEGGRFGLTLKNCETDETTTKCDADVFGLGDLGKFCLSTGTALGTAGREELVISTGDRGSMNIKKKGNTIISSEIIRPSCEISPGATDISYMLQSRQIYLKFPGNDSGQCYQDTSPAMHEVCTDAKVLRIIERAESVPFPSEHVDGFWGDEPGMLTNCNQTASPQDCVLEAYQHKLDELEADSHQMSAYGLPGNTLKAQKLLGTMGGVYKRRFKNGDTSGATYQSEDVFEFVPVSPFAAYMKLHLEFYNGHECSVAGIAEYKAIAVCMRQCAASCRPSARAREWLTIRTGRSNVGLNRGGTQLRRISWIVHWPDGPRSSWTGRDRNPSIGRSALSRRADSPALIFGYILSNGVF